MFGYIVLGLLLIGLGYCLGEMAGYARGYNAGRDDAEEYDDLLADAELQKG